jgi:hypothetical protein
MIKVCQSWKNFVEPSQGSRDSVLFGELSALCAAFWPEFVISRLSWCLSSSVVSPGEARFGDVPTSSPSKSVLRDLDAMTLLALQYSHNRHPFLYDFPNQYRNP